MSKDKHANSRIALALDPFLNEAAGRIFPAAVVHISQDGQILYHRAVGRLDPAVEQPATAGPKPSDLSLFDLASLTKLFTTTAFLRLVAEGEVTLNSPVGGILPDFGGLRPIQPYEDPLQPGHFINASQETGLVDASQVTFRHLLAHNSGLPAWRPLFRQPPEAIPAVVLETFFAYRPGSRVVYSDLGFILLGWAIERMSRRRLDEAVAGLVLAPLDWPAIRFGPAAPAESAPTELCAWRERRMQGEVHDENSWAMGGIAGHAGLFGSAAGLAALGQAWLDSLYGGPVTLLPQPLAQEAVRCQAKEGQVRRGLGWLLWSPEAETVGHPLGPDSFGHTGFTGTSLFVDPKRRLVIACLTNYLYYGRRPQAIQAFRRALHELVVKAI
ncbi:MAG: beta-lactamase family protein [Chloroflexi bacterium]|nr:beta-lactamase family protein [Chloroflexota bacterium]MCI0576260.1 beta-lactamase family protein [Chloroflexota bacterium]MCI0644544.1 beta-lactamase family protein [Chloroflexota bacterium]MCI0728767.1 beta-lactamase family protein [Chloroflexota bacterium]